MIIRRRALKHVFTLTAASALDAAEAEDIVAPSRVYRPVAGVLEFIRAYQNRLHNKIRLRISN
jgi:hypothetical protein